MNRRPQDFHAIKEYCERRGLAAANGGNMRAAVAWAKLEHIAFRCTADARVPSLIPDEVAIDQDAKWETLLDDLWGGSISSGEFSDAARDAGFSIAEINTAIAEARPC